MLPFEFLGPYRISDSIGKGGMGSVFKAVHEKTGEAVAVKVISSAVADDPRFRRRFHAEIETLKKLQHPNIVRLIGYGEQHGQLFYSMELVEGESLQERLRREKRLPWAPVLDMAIEICGALKYAHNFGIIHRDLKPANLLITRQDRIKLVDFGIVKMFGSTDQTAAGAVLGTADYMAPEQAGDGPITPATDLYALGNVMYACLAGRSPFSGRSMTKIIESLRYELPVSLDLVIPDLPTDLVAMVHDLLQKDPQQRPPTALAAMNRMKAMRLGLEKVEREQSQSSAPTVIVESELTGHDDRLKRDGTVELSALDSAVKNTFRDKDFELTRSPAKPLPSGLDVTLVSGAEVSPVQPVAIEERPTHFSTVKDDERGRGTWETTDKPATEQGIWQMLSVALLVLALIGCGFGIFWATRRPTADVLYGEILVARESGDETKLRSSVDQFKRLYPQDKRVDELEDFDAVHDRMRTLRRLRLEAIRNGGEQYLAPPAQALLQATRTSQTDVSSAKTMLRNWLDVYAPQGAKSPYADDQQLAELVDAATQELARLDQVRSLPTDSRAQELLQRMSWAEQNLPTAGYQKLLQGIVALHHNDAWAEPAVAEAVAELSSLAE